MKKKPFFFRSATWIILVVFSWMTVFPSSFVQAQTVPLPISTNILPLTPPFAPLNLQGIKIYPDNPFRLDFMIDPGETQLSADELKIESEKLIKYFLASITVPERDLWVNLSPYEPDKIIPHKFGKTDMGRDLLQQDYLLKEMSASLMYPDTEVGKEFWNRIYEKMDAIYGTTDIPVNTFNKVWVVPQVAQVYVYEGAAVVSDSYLQVMVESDYVAQKNNRQTEDHSYSLPLEDDTAQLSAKIIKELILPELEKEINTGKNFIQLRQIYNALILATWFKRNLKESILGKDYVDQNKIEGIDTYEIQAKERIYEAYLKKFEEGFFNFVREDYDPRSQQILSRKYVAGGVNFFGRMKDIYHEVRSSELPQKFRMGQAAGRFSQFIKVAAVVVSQSGIDWYHKMALAKNELSRQSRPTGRSLVEKITQTVAFQSISAFKKPFLRGFGRLIASVVLLTTVGFSSATLSAEYSLDDNHQLTVQVEKGNQLGRIFYEFKQAQKNNDPDGYTIPLSNHLWGPGGAVDVLSQLAGFSSPNDIDLAGVDLDSIQEQPDLEGALDPFQADQARDLDDAPAADISDTGFTDAQTPLPEPGLANTSTSPSPIENSIGGESKGATDLSAAEESPVPDLSRIIPSATQQQERSGPTSSIPPQSEPPATQSPPIDTQPADSKKYPEIQTLSPKFAPPEFQYWLLDRLDSESTKNGQADVMPTSGLNTVWAQVADLKTNFDVNMPQITWDSLPPLPEGKPSTLLTTSFLSFVGLALLGRRARKRARIQNDGSGRASFEAEGDVPEMTQGREAVIEPFALSLKTAIKNMTPGYGRLIQGAQESAREKAEQLGNRLNQKFTDARYSAGDVYDIVDSEFLAPSSRSIFHLSLMTADVLSLESTIDETAQALAQQYANGGIDDVTLYYQLAHFSEKTVSSRVQTAQSAIDAFFTQNPFSPRGQNALASAIDVVFTRTWESRDAGDLARRSFQAWWNLLLNTNDDFKPRMEDLGFDENIGMQLDAVSQTANTNDESLIPTVVLRTVQTVSDSLVDQIAKNSVEERTAIQSQVRQEFDPFFGLLLLDGWKKNNQKIFEEKVISFYQNAVVAAVVATQTTISSDTLTPTDIAIHKLKHNILKAFSDSDLDIAPASLGVAFGIDALKEAGDVTGEEDAIISDQEHGSDVARAPPVSGWKGDTLSSLVVATLGWLAGADAQTIQISAVAAPFIYRSTMAASYWLHEATHTLTAGPKNWTLKNILGNILPGEWASMLIPYYGDIPSDIHVSKTDGSEFSTAQRSVAFLTSATLSAGALFSAGISLVQGDLMNTALWGSIALGTLPVAVGSFKTDIIDSLRGKIDSRKACCGVVAGVFMRPAGDTSILDLKQLRIFERMGKVTTIRGQQQAGFFTPELSRTGQVSWFSTKLVNGKRTALPPMLSNSARYKMGIQYLLGSRPVGETGIVLVHYRYSTSSPPIDREGQPVQWEREREVVQTILVDGHFDDIKVNLHVVATANGDFNHYKIYKKRVDNEKIGWWLERVLQTPDDRRADTPKMAGKLDYLISPGIWIASVRYAFYEELVDSFDWVFGGVAPSKQGVSQAVSNDVLERIGDVFRNIFDEERDQLISSDVKSMNDIWVDPYIGDEQLTNSQRLRRNKILDLQDLVFEKLKDEDTVNVWGDSKIRNFIRVVFESYFMHDEFAAVEEFLDRVEGSSGMAMATTLKPDEMVIGAQGQPLAVGWNPDRSIHLVASEPKALQVPLDNNGREFLTEMIQLNQDPGGGEIGIISQGSLKIYSLKSRRFLTETELRRDNRIEPLQHNPYVDPLPPMDREDPVKDDLARIPELMNDIKDHWQDENSMNRKTQSELFKKLLTQKIKKQVKRRLYPSLEASVSSRAREIYSRASAELKAGVADLIEGSPDINWDRANKPLIRMVDLFKGALYNMFEHEQVDVFIAKKVDLWVESTLSEQLDAGIMDIEIDDFIQGELKTFVQERLDNVTEEVENIYKLYSDSLNTEYLSQLSAGLAFKGSDTKVRKAVDRVMDSFAVFFRSLDVDPGIPPQPESADLLVMGTEVSHSLGERFAKDMKAMFPELNIVFGSSNDQLENLKANGVDKETIVLAVSQSGQTFPTLNATIAYEELSPGRVFVLTGEWKTLMGYAVGQQYTPDARFSQRIFCNLSGYRMTEPPSYTADATHATLTEILLQLVRNFRQVYPYTKPLGLELEDSDIVELEKMRDTAIEEAERLVGVSRDGKLVESAERDSFVKQARKWAWNVLDVPLKTLASRLNLYVGLPLIVVGGLVAILASSIPLTTTLGLIASALIFGVYYDAFPYAVVYITRALQKRHVFARVGNRTIVINDVPHVHKLLTQFLSKMNALSFAGTGINVFGADPADESLHSFGHRVVRGVMIFLGRPDGRLEGLSRSANAVDMTGKQARGVRNFKVGAEVVSVGRDRSPNPNAADVELTISGEPATKNLRLMNLFENRFDSLTRMVAGQVFFYEMMHEIVQPQVLPAWTRRFWPWKHIIDRTQSGTGVATTAAPVENPTVEDLQALKEEKPYLDAQGIMNRLGLDTQAQNDNDTDLDHSVGRPEKSGDGDLLDEKKGVPDSNLGSSDQALLSTNSDADSQVGGIDLFMGDLLKVDGMAPAFEMDGTVEMFNGLGPGVYAPFILDIQLIPSVNMFLGVQ